MQRSKLTAAQQKWLDQELAVWQSDQIVSTDQANQIRGRYESADEINDRKRSVAVQALFAMAALLFGLAVLLLIGFNWDQLSREIKLVVVLSVVTITHLIAFRLRSGGQVALSEVVSFLGCLFYGAGIWLIAQAFHLAAHYPDGVWWWAVGVLPFALCLDSLLLHMLFVGLLGLWSGMEVFGFAHLSPWWGLRWWQIPNGAYSLPLLALPGLIWAYHRKSALAISLYVPLFAWWTVLQAFALQLHGRSIFWIGNVGAILILLAEAHRPRDPRGVPYRFWGVVMVSGILLAMGSYGFWQGLSHWQPDWDFESRWQPIVTEIIASFSLLGLSAGLLFAIRGFGAFALQGEAAELDSARRRWFAISLVGSLMFMSIWSLAIPDETIATGLPIVLANVVTLGMAMYLVKVGEQEERTRPFAAGILMFLLWALIRYIDLFGESGGMLGAAIVFALCGGGLVVVGNFWSRKRKALQQTSATPPAESLATPVWVNSVVDTLRRHRVTILLSTAIAQVGLLGGMILIESLPLLIGERIVMQVTPIDPRDFFRGDYVILNYSVNNLPLPGDQQEFRSRDRFAKHNDETVYVPLEADADGVHWTGTTASLTRPAGVKYLRGRITSDYRQPLQFGIEAYYVQEGTGKILEDLRNARQLNAEIAIAPWGQAKLVRLF